MYYMYPYISGVGSMSTVSTCAATPHHDAATMPRLPLPALLHRASPSHLTRASAPRISAPILCPGHRHSHRHRRLPSAIHERHFIAAPSHHHHRHRAHYTPPARLPNAAWPYLYRRPNSMAHLDPYFAQVDGLQQRFIERLREAVAIPSISSEDHRRPDVVKVRFVPAG